MKEVAEMN